ncbi:MAG: hypothetical protein KAU62_06420 [Candidatus Heimdallarchaeota archaeon]|nr:hypothetical protein [Candidatus Heimdallarchaeota archaeon]MCG3255700.1 hypothetical protein [Candidatus Heimdallarchaeota archaeon]MCK4610774.1 hypothetical protein [Candidatus Heimdallarchaeota archaeon]
MRVLEDFQIKLDDNEILRLLQNKQSDKEMKKPSENVIKEIEEMKELALPLIKPRGIYKIYESKDFRPKFLFKKSDISVFAICTIGKDLENLSRDYLKRGELAKGVILDAIASHAAEQTAEEVNQIILNELSDTIQEKEVSCRFSPGYCQWELDKGQKQIFSLLDSEKIGVSLTTSMMMNPVKSVSFAINIGVEVDKELGIRGCENCDMINCAYRRTK